MCKPKNVGPRCAGHARAYLKRCKENLDKAKLEYIQSNKATEYKEKLDSAETKFYHSRIIYATTPKGSGELIEQIQKAEADGRDTSELLSIQARATAQRKRDMAVYGSLSLPKEAVITNSKNRNIAGLRLVLSDHALKTAREKMFDMDTVVEAFKNPEKVYPNGRYPGQFRVTGEGLCLTGEVINGQYYVRTMYLDGVVTPPRKDQLQTKHGAEFARHYSHTGGTQRLTNYADA